MRDREKKGKECERYVDVSGLEEEKLEAVRDEATAQDKDWLQKMLEDLKERTNDVSDFERSMTTVQFEMKDVKENMNEVTKAISKMSDENRARDRKFEKLINKICEGLYERDLKTDQKLEGLEKRIDTKIEEKFAGLETRICAMEKDATMSKERRGDSAQSKSRYVPTECKALLHGFTIDNERRDHS